MSACQPSGVETFAPPPHDWRDRAACRATDPALAWSKKRAHAFARANCAYCPVINRCSETADALHAPGTWAGAHRAVATRGSQDRYVVVTYLIPEAPRHFCTREDCPVDANDCA